MPDFNHYIFGSIDDRTGHIQPSFTTTLWVKRTALSGDMVVFTYVTISVFLEITNIKSYNVLFQ